MWLPILHEELASELLAYEPKLVAMNPEHRLASKPAITPDDLVDEPIVAPWELYSRATLTFWLGPFREARKELDVYAESIDECMNFCRPRPRRLLRARVGRALLRPA